MESQSTVYAFIISPYTWDSTLAKGVALIELRVGHNSDDGVLAAAQNTFQSTGTISESTQILQQSG